MSRMLARKPVAKYRLDYSVTNLSDTTTWHQVVAATSQPCSAIEIFNSCASALRISTGATGQEAAGEIPYFVLPGGSGIMLPWEIAKGKPISIKAEDAAQVPISQGAIIINLFG